jgi:hypothetical protein
MKRRSNNLFDSNETLIKLSTRSVVTNLARRFNGGPRAGSPRGVVAPGSGSSLLSSRSDDRVFYGFERHYATRTLSWLFPALKGRAKFVGTLRVEVVITGILKSVLEKHRLESAA